MQRTGRKLDAFSAAFLIFFKFITLYSCYSVKHAGSHPCIIVLWRKCISGLVSSHLNTSWYHFSLYFYQYKYSYLTTRRLVTSLDKNTGSGPKLPWQLFVFPEAKDPRPVDPVIYLLLLLSVIIIGIVLLKLSTSISYSFRISLSTDLHRGTVKSKSSIKVFPLKW